MQTIKTFSNTTLRKIQTLRKKQYVFRVSSEGLTRTESIRAESLLAAEEMMREINPRCVVKFLWVQD
jgi:hypothetical protein